MHFKDIEINNFRGFDYLKIEDFGQINLFVGKNNSGKTSVLEAFAFLSTPHNIQIASSINEWVRDFSVKKISDYFNFFHNQSIENEPTINASLVNKTISQSRVLKLSISDILTFDLGGFPTNSTFSAKYKINKESFELKTIFENGAIPKYESNLKKETIINTQIIAGKQPFQNLFFFVGRLREIKNTSQLVTVLKKIEPRLLDIEVVDGKVLLNLDGIDKLLPINFNGDGIQKIATIIAAIFWIKDGILFIDEIENGLHYTAHKTLWKGIIDACKVANVQIFATTHSLESLKYLNEVLQEKEYIDFQEKVRCYDLVKTKLKGFQAYKYNFEGFSHALEMETEIR
jgi:AAA15 family ATPase/GTPase